MEFRDWLFNRLPPYFKLYDTYLDINKEGLLERYLRVYGLELDEEIIPGLENYLDILDPLLCDEKFLNHIAYQLGTPPDLFNTTSLYRKFLSIILGIYKIKGTRKSYILLFSLLGYAVDLIINYPEDTVYDDGNEYDDEENFYDDTCGTCVEYTIIFHSSEADCQHPELFIIPEITEEIEQLFRRVACFLEPINAKLLGLIPSMPICESVGVSFSEEVTITINNLVFYDTESEYDDNLEYDPGSLTTITYIWP